MRQKDKSRKSRTHNMVKSPGPTIPDVLVHQPSRAKLLASLDFDGSYSPWRRDGLVLGVFEPKTHFLGISMFGLEAGMGAKVQVDVNLEGRT